MNGTSPHLRFTPQPRYFSDLTVHSREYGTLLGRGSLQVTGTLPDDGSLTVSGTSPLLRFTPQPRYSPMCRFTPRPRYSLRYRFTQVTRYSPHPRFTCASRYLSRLSVHSAAIRGSSLSYAAAISGKNSSRCGGRMKWTCPRCSITNGLGGSFR